VPGERAAAPSPPSRIAAVRRLPGRLRAFFTERIWDVRTTDLGPGRGLLYRVSRIGYSTVRGIDENRLTFRAAALTYFSVLSVVPFLAFAFAVLKGFGAYRSFVDGTVRPYLATTFQANPSLLAAIEKILEFVERTDVSRLGTVGVLFLVYTSVSLLSSIEVTLNDVWGAKAQRPPLRQLTDYVTLLVIGPLLVLVAATFATAAQSSDALRFLRETLALGPVIDFLLRFTSVVIVGIALFATYLILPNTRTRVVSALVGAAIAALLWQLALVLHVQFQMGVAKYNALYSVLGAVPIFLVWTYASWVIVLVGAQLAASHQNERTVRQRLQARRADQALKETLAVALAARVARDFLAGAPRRTHEQLAELLEVPPPTVEEILEALVRAGLLAKAVSGREIGYVPGRDLDGIRVADLRDALRRDPAADPIRAAVARQIGPGVRRVVDAVEAEGRESRANVTLRELAALPARGDAPDDAATDGGPPPGDAPVLDAKQPDIPA
jgi:membrane protein